jgi:hypothetical protein
MAVYSYKVIAQSAPSAITNTDMYTVGTNTQTIISTITVCNRGTSAATYRIAIRPNGASVLNQHYLAYDAVIAANDTIAMTMGITMDAADVFTIYASNANLSFGLYGSELA